MVWIFGYGSLIWKMDYPFKRKLVGHVRGYRRRFWWLSEDHRGVPGSPGLVVNLLPSENPGDRVWGVAYEIDDVVWRNEVRAVLDHREKGGYEKLTATFYHQGEMDAAAPETVTLYLGCPSNRLYAGPTAVADAARIIHASEGPSGPNKDYLYHLADCMREIDPEDEHLFELEKAVRALDKRDGHGDNK